MSKGNWFAVVSFGGPVAGTKGAFTSREEAAARIARAHLDTACGGRFKTDQAVLASARVEGPFPSRAAARAADISR